MWNGMKIFVFQTELYYYVKVNFKDNFKRQINHNFSYYGGRTTENTVL